MGQYFTAFNIDKREHVSFTLSKLGEFLFGNDPNRIFFHLLRLTVTFELSSHGNDHAPEDR
jgi:hypothetical protein